MNLTDDNKELFLEYYNNCLKTNFDSSEFEDCENFLSHFYRSNKVCYSKCTFCIQDGVVIGGSIYDVCVKERTIIIEFLITNIKGQGIGTELWNNIRLQYPTYGVVIEIADDDTRAKTFWEHFGFTISNLAYEQPKLSGTEKTSIQFHLYTFGDTCNIPRIIAKYYKYGMNIKFPKFTPEWRILYKSWKHEFSIDKCDTL